jgi:hypothetical protein
LCVYVFFVGGSFVRVRVLCGWYFCACTCFVWVVVLCVYVFLWVAVLCVYVFCVGGSFVRVCFLWVVVLCGW